MANNELNLLYKNAEAFIFPSLYEGFGFPLIESFANQCPVICSNTSCFEEVGGHAALYFNPYHADEMTDAIAKILADKNLRDNLIKNGLEQIKRFTIEKNIEATKKVYQSLK